MDDSRARRERVRGSTQENSRRLGQLAPAQKPGVIAHAAKHAQHRQAVYVEYGLGLRVIADIDAIAGQAENAGHAHGRCAEHVALNRDPVAVPRRYLHHHRVAAPRQQRAHADAGHVTVCPRSVGRIDRVHVAVELRGALVYFGWIRRIRRRDFGGHCEAAGPQHALEPAERGVPGPDRQRIAGNQRFVFKLHVCHSRP